MSAKCKKTRCGYDVYRIGLCQRHYYHRNQGYKYIGYKSDSGDISVLRTCLMCDKKFHSFGNRRCDLCNKTTDCEYESQTSLYIKT